MEFINKNPKIFIVSGKASSGKDLVSNIICSKYSDKNCKKLSYAYYLKQYVKNITEWDGSEENKPRDLLQSIGIDLIKNKIDNNFLVNRMCEDITVYSYFYDVIVITDARLLEEIEVPKDKFSNVKTIRVNRNIENSLTKEQKNHITETNLDDYQNFDYIIENDGDYNKLDINTKRILEEVNNEV